MLVQYAVMWHLTLVTKSGVVMALAALFGFLPQAVVYMVPTFCNNAIELLKATAVVSLISLSDLTFQAQAIRLQTGNTAIPFIAALLIYFAISLVISRGVRRLESHLSAGLDVTKN